MSCLVNRVIILSDGIDSKVDVIEWIQDQPKLDKEDLNKKPWTITQKLFQTGDRNVQLQHMSR